jgi:hypothetical protein
MLTEVQSGLDGRAGSMATLTGGGTEAELADGVLQWSSGHLDLHGQVRRRAAKVYQGSGRGKGYRRQGNRGGGPTYLRQRPAQFRLLQVMWSRIVAAGLLLVLERSFCGGSW